jgi:multiple antibiotic resistance protein
MASKILGEFLIGYSTLISIINPFGLAFVFNDITRSLAPVERAALALRISIYSFCTLVVTAILGNYILAFFGITLAALKIAGGIAVALAGWGLLNKPDAEPSEDQPPSEVQRASIEAMAYYPLTMPLTTGPGSMAAAIALVANRSYDGDLLTLFIGILVVAVCVAFTVYVCYRWSGWFSAHIGVVATRIFARIAAFLLLCVGVQIIITGVIDVIRTATAPI